MTRVHALDGKKLIAKTREGRDTKGNKDNVSNHSSIGEVVSHYAFFYSPPLHFPEKFH